MTLTAANGYEWMDRNLGALNNTPGDVANRGLFYQWGRKDPFLPSSAPYTTGNVTEANVENHQVGDGTAEWAYTGVRQHLLTEAPGNIEKCRTASDAVPENLLPVFGFVVVRDADQRCVEGGRPVGRK